MLPASPPLKICPLTFSSLSLPVEKPLFSLEHCSPPHLSFPFSKFLYKFKARDPNSLGSLGLTFPCKEQFLVPKSQSSPKKYGDRDHFPWCWKKQDVRWLAGQKFYQNEAYHWLRVLHLQVVLRGATNRLWESSKFPSPDSFLLNAHVTQETTTINNL